MTTDHGALVAIVVIIIITIIVVVIASSSSPQLAPGVTKARPDNGNVPDPKTK